MAISSDGKVVVGWGSTDEGTEAFRWTADAGLQGLGDLPGGVSSAPPTECRGMVR